LCFAGWIGTSCRKEAVVFCPRCGLRQPLEHRFCVACGTHLPVHILERKRPKVSRWFLGVPVGTDDPPEAALRVSRYLEEILIEAPEGSTSIPNHHVRFSIWVEDTAVAALSLPDDEAASLGEFLLAAVPNGDEVRTG
jgi:hypothetical protein